MNWGALGGLVLSGASWFLIGYAIAWLRVQNRELADFKRQWGEQDARDQRVQAILARMKSRGGWLEYAEYAELVGLWSGFAPLMFKVMQHRPIGPTHRETH